MGLGPARPGPASATLSDTSIYPTEGEAYVCGDDRQRQGGGAAWVPAASRSPRELEGIAFVLRAPPGLGVRVPRSTGSGSQVTRQQEPPLCVLLILFIYLFIKAEIINQPDL
ncbi:unnamed protein product [Coccothraustes coccothraustes]